MRCDKQRATTLVLFFLCVAFVFIASIVRSSTKQVLVYRKKYVMGTVFEIAAYDPSPDRAANAIEKAFGEVVRLDYLLSNYKPDSVLSHLNRSAHFHTEKIPPDLYVLIEQTLRYSRLSEGEFDISVAPLVDLWKAALAGDSMPSMSQIEQARNCVGYEKIELTPPDQITFRSPCMRLDVGAIGKGYAVDKAADVLRSWGVRNALINAGGSTIVAMGSPPGQTGWLLHARDPSHKIDPQIMLTDESLSTSEQTAPTLLGRESAGHIIDPTTGLPLRTDFAVSVVAKIGTASDALSTSLLLLGPAKGKALIQRLGGISAIWISPDAKMETVTGGPQILFPKGL